MTRLESALLRTREQGRIAVVPYITAGFPDLNTTRDLIVKFTRAGVAAIEIGVPFSDPMADGPVIQRACEAALSQGTNLTGILGAIRDAKKEEPAATVVLFSYLNPLLQYGLDRLADDAADAGVAGVLVTDLPADAAQPFSSLLQSHGIDFVSLIAPTSSDERLAQIGRTASGFIYAVSRTGVTGTQSELSNEAELLVRRARKFTKLPIALGFGISRPEHAIDAVRFADAVIVGSAVMRVLQDSPKELAADNAVEFITAFTQHQSAAAVSE